MRHSQHSILAIETVQGEVFGCFTSSPWRINGTTYYGSCEAFVWNLRKKRQSEDCRSLDEYILRESSLEAYQWNAKGGNHRNVQLSNNRQLFVGGGNPDVDDFSLENDTNDNTWGVALALDKDLCRGTSCRCATFASNPLMESSHGSDVFEIMNMEIWVSAPPLILY